jgi:hypothetical protein
MRAAALALLAAMVLGGCKAPEPAPSIRDFRMPVPAGFAEPLRLEDKSIVEPAALAAEEAPGDALVRDAFTQQGIVGSAYWRYWRDAEGPRGLYKVKATLYRDAETLAAAWERRYPPVALVGTEPLSLGDGGFLLPGNIAGFRHGALMVEIKAEGSAAQLADFVAAYGRFVMEQSAARR